jgi:hypothetical protein
MDTGTDTSRFKEVSVGWGGGYLKTKSPTPIETFSID